MDKEIDLLLKKLSIEIEFDLKKNINAMDEVTFDVDSDYEEYNKELVLE